MDPRFEKFTTQLATYNGSDNTEVRATYARLADAEKLIPIAKGDQRILVATALWLAECFAFKFYREQGAEIDTNAIRLEGEGAGHTHGMFGQTSGDVLQDMHDAVFQFLTRRNPEFSEEWQELLQDNPDVTEKD